YVTVFGNKMPNARPSMLLDHMARRASEIDFINGAIPPLSNEQGLSAPYNEVISGIVRSREAEFG
ncbi:MAG: ketopantoate reductase C-terminal domain-containing protein, partial [Pseudomonadota bacterium]